MISRIPPSNHNNQTKNNPNFKSKIVKNDFLQSGIEYAKANPTKEESFFFFKSLHNLLNDGQKRTLKIFKDGIQIKGNGTVRIEPSQTKNIENPAEACVDILNNFAENENSFFKKTNSKVENLFNQIEDHKDAIENLEEDLSIEMKESLEQISHKLI